MAEYADPLLNDIAARLDADDPGIRRVAVLELPDSGEPEAVELMVRALRDPDVGVRQEAAKVVDEFEAADMAEALLAALGDEDEVVRNAAAHALADLKDPAAASPLLEALIASRDPFVVAGILRALKPLRVAAAAEPALNRLDDADPTVRREAVGVLGYLKDPARLARLMEVARQDPDAEVRRTAVGTLVYGEAATVGPVLIESLADDHWQVRCEAALAAGKLEIVEATEPLIAATGDSLWQVREKAANALGSLGAVAAVDAIGACAVDAMSNVRKTAVGALGALGHSSCRRYVEQALEDPDPDVRKVARWAQSRLQDVA